MHVAAPAAVHRRKHPACCKLLHALHDTSRIGNWFISTAQQRLGNGPSFMSVCRYAPSRRTVLLRTAEFYLLHRESMMKKIEVGIGTMQQRDERQESGWKKAAQCTSTQNTGGEQITLSTCSIHDPVINSSKATALSRIYISPVYRYGVFMYLYVRVAL